MSLARRYDEIAMNSGREPAGDKPPIEFLQTAAWVSGQYKVIAMLDVPDMWVAVAVGRPMIAEFDEGWGWCVGTGGLLPSGTLIALFRYESQLARLFEVRVDLNADAHEVLGELMRATGLEDRLIRWRDPAAYGKPVYTIDGERFTTLEEFYEEISRVLIPGADWGRNLDAFNDILRGGFGTPEGGFVLRWLHSDLSRRNLGYAETVRQLEKRLERCHPSNREHFAQELEVARRGGGSTVFDWLVDIIHVHTPGGDEAEDGVVLVLE